MQFDQPIEMKTRDFSNVQTNDEEIESGLATGEYGAIGQNPQKFESNSAGGGHSVVAEKLGRKYEGMVWGINLYQMLWKEI